MNAFEAIGALIIGDEILSGKREDKHLAHVIATLATRGLALDFVHYLGDDRARLTALLVDSFRRRDLVFSFGGIGATPDDHTRQAAAAALGVPLVRHPEAVASIEARFGDAAYPHRVLMAEFPQGATIIPNPVNQVAAFSIRDHHFFPGFPQMAWPMLAWVLATHYPTLVRERAVERALVVHDAGESQLLPLMNDNVARFSRVKLFCLPAFVGEGRRRLELGVRGAKGDVDEAFAHLLAGVVASGFPYETLDDR
ncbi:MAG TPA: molybdopterin-binding protein [Casimicrobiaceae bacterium]|nr:molybdopterin-binding protein [Casimicrobiaceae bacterium]